MAYRLRSIIDDAYTLGKYTYSSFRKVAGIASSAGCWVDLSVAAGTPKPNYYVGDQLAATVPSAWYKHGLWHGGAVSPEKKILHKLNILGTSAVAAPAVFMVCDYLLYYPLIDMDSTDTQTLDNSTARLPRYTTGVGVQAFLVATQPYIGGATFQISYTNHLGEAGHISKITLTNTATFIGTLVNSGTAGLINFGPFVQLQQGDLGIRSVENITFLASNGGLASLVLVRPIVYALTREAKAYMEIDYIKDRSSTPIISDDAYLNFLCMPSGSIAAIPIVGAITTIWGGN